MDMHGMIGISLDLCKHLGSNDQHMINKSLIYPDWTLNYSFLFQPEPMNIFQPQARDIYIYTFRPRKSELQIIQRDSPGKTAQHKAVQSIWGFLHPSHKVSQAMKYVPLDQELKV